MISFLRGRVVEREVRRAVIECAGVGYEVACSDRTMAALPELGGEAALWVLTRFPQDKIVLYGFATRDERELFDELLSAEKVGPRHALAILSGGDAVDVARMIVAEDLAALSAVKGVGKQTAERVVRDVKKKCQALLAGWGAPASPAEPAPPRRTDGRAPVLDDVASALVNLGWRTGDVDRMLVQLAIAEEDTVETLVRKALRAMPR
jgi:Holliday junction DNA helicase RuvA